MKRLLIELGCEEIPAFVQEKLSKEFYDFVIGRLRELSFKVGEGKYFATPRRIALTLDVSPYNERITVERKGPPVSVAYDKEGKPTKALLGFLKSMGASLDDVFVIKEGSKEYVGIKLEKGGEHISRHLNDILNEFIRDVQLPKMMRWDDSGITFIRPIRWLICLLGDEIMDINIGRIGSSNYTFGPRIPNQKIILSRAEEYEEVLERNGIIPDFRKRLKHIYESVESYFKINKNDFEKFAVDIDSLLYEIAGLVEKGYAVYGRFDERFLKDLYPEVITVAMVSHQRYVPHIEDGSLKPGFIAFSNNPKNLENQRKGFERVLKARLEDALFYKTQDLKVPMDEHVENLKNILWLRGLGSLYDKVLRVSEILERLPVIKVDENYKKVARYYLFDTATSMIGDGKEFTKLEGKIGYYYAKDIWGDENLARGIYDAHLPKGGEFPTTLEGHSVGIADCITQIDGLLKIGYKWTSSRDPMGIRAYTKKFVSLLLYENKGVIFAKEDLEEFLKLFESDRNKVRELISDMYIPSIKYIQEIFSYEFYPINALYAEITFKGDNLYIEAVKGRVMEERIKGENLQKFITVCKRVRNILNSKTTKFLKDEGGGEVYEDKLIRHIEGMEKFGEKLANWRDMEGHRDVKSIFGKFVDMILELHEILDEFFSNVPVMVDDEAVRGRRLRLIERAYNLIGKLMNFDNLDKLIFQG